MKIIVKNIVLWVCGILSVVPLFSQHTIKGKIVNVQKQAIQKAILTIYKLQDTSLLLVKKEINQEDGSFSYSLPKDTGMYYLIVSPPVNFEDQKIAFEINKDTILLGTIILKNRQLLDEITISTKKRKNAIEVFPDKTIFNVSDNTGTSGLNGLELLRKAPGVFVDKDDNIKLKGLSGVQIYIDGRPSYMDGKDLANYLKSMNSNDIESIELISNPSSAYDAQGQAGIINIKLKKDAKRTVLNGTVFVDQGVSLYPKYRLNTGASLNFRSNRFLLYGSYSLSIGNYHNNSIFDRVQGDSNIKNIFYNNYHHLTHNLNVGMEFYIKKYHTFSLTMKGNFNNSNGNTSNITSVYPIITP